MSRIEGIYIYETQEEHDFRIQAENRRYRFQKKKGRSDARRVNVKRVVWQRAGGKCEICSFAFGSVLIRHHIWPVHLGGHGQPSNLILLCPNCHSIVHNYNHYGRLDQKKYPGWIKGIMKAGLTEDQARLVLLVASKDALVEPDGSVVSNPREQPLVSVRVDENGEVIDPDFDRAKIDAALQNIERRFGLSSLGEATT